MDNAFARHLGEASARHYGHSIRVFLAALAGDVEGHAADAREVRDDFTAAHCPPGGWGGTRPPNQPTSADGQVLRVAARFGLIAAAAQFAAGIGLLSLSAAEIDGALAGIFRRWLMARGGMRSGEEMQALRQLRAFIERYGDSRFAPYDRAPDRVIPDRAGFRRASAGGGEAVEYLIFPDVFKREAMAGLNANGGAKALASAGALITTAAGDLTCPMKPHGEPKQRFYRISADALFGEG